MKVTTRRWDESNTPFIDTHRMLIDGGFERVGELEGTEFWRHPDGRQATVDADPDGVHVAEVMPVQCSWCKLWVARLWEPNAGEPVTHTICPACAAEHFPEPSLLATVGTFLVGRMKRGAVEIRTRFGRVTR